MRRRSAAATARMWQWCAGLAVLCLTGGTRACEALPPRGDLGALRAAWSAQVDRRLSVPDGEAQDYARRLEEALARHGVTDRTARFAVLVDRSPRIQALLLFWRSPEGGLGLVGAAPCTTGRAGRYEHFLTPLGVFDHGLTDPDFRAEGTRNALGVRGYGVAGMRVFDFGWVLTERGWGRGGPGWMRLQLHATDPDLLETRLGRTGSKGCIRIPGSVNVFLDCHGVLDADYESSAAAGRTPWQLRPDRRPSPWAGRHLVVVESARARRPAWAGAPPPRDPLRPR